MRQSDIRTEHIAQFHRWMEGDLLSEKAKTRLQCILQYLQHDTSAADAAAMFGVTANTLCRWIDRFNPDDPSSLEEKSRRARTPRSTQLAPDVVSRIRNYRIAAPKMGKHEIALVLRRDHGVTASASAIGRLIERYCLYFADSPLHARKRLRARLVNGKMSPIVAVLLIVGMLLSAPGVQGAAALLVNTESFDVIDAAGQGTDVELRFGDTTGEKLYWNVAQSRFQFSDDLHVQDNLTASGGLAIEQNIRAKGDATINSDNGAENATLTFGNVTQAQTFGLVHALQKFRISTSLDVAGTMSGYALTVSGLRNCDTIDTDENGVLQCGTDDGGAGGGLSQSDADARYLRLSGGTMTGSLSVQGTISGAVLKALNMTVSGAVVYSSGSTLKQTAKGASGQLLISQGTSAPKWANPLGGMIWYFDGIQSVVRSKGPQITMPFAVTLSGVLLKAKGAPTGADFIVDVNKDGVSIFGTRPQITAGATRGGTGAVLTTTTIPANSCLTLDVDQVGSTFAGSGMTIMLTGTRKY